MCSQTGACANERKITKEKVNSKTKNRGGNGRRRLRPNSAAWLKSVFLGK
jgi:hypothetical protein